MIRYDCFWHFNEITKHLCPAGQRPQRNFAHDKRVDENSLCGKQRCHRLIAARQMIDPNRSISQNHSNRRLGGATKSGEEPPIRANRRDASRSTKACSAFSMTADFSFTPAYSWAWAKSSSSIAIVALIIELLEWHGI